MSEVVTRKMEAVDSGEVLTLQRAAYASEAQLYGDPFLPPLVQTLDELRDELVSGEGLVGLSGSRIVASVRWTVSDGIARIGRLIVAPDLQGQGWGTKLLNLAERESGATTAELFTGQLSEGNIRLYKREGYVESRREQINDELEFVHLTKNLAQMIDSKGWGGAFAQ